MEVKIAVNPLGKPLNDVIEPYSFKKSTLEGTKPAERREPLKPSELELEAKGKIKDRKIFVGGIGNNLSFTAIATYFAVFGKVKSVNILKKDRKNVRRGFCFVVFAKGRSAAAALSIRFHLIGSTRVEVKKALPKQINSSSQDNLNENMKLYLNQSEQSNLKQRFFDYILSGEEQAFKYFSSTIKLINN